MTAALAIARVTTHRILGLKRVIGFGLLALVPSLIYFAASQTQSPQGQLQDFLAIQLGLFFAVIVPVITLILAATSLGDERREQTLSFIMVRPVSRYVIAASKLTAAAVATFAVAAPGAAALAIVYAARAGDWAYVVPSVIATAVAAAVYSSLFLILGYITERSTVLGLAYVLIWENGVVFAIPALATTSPWRLGYSAYLGLAPAAALDEMGDALGDLAAGAAGSIVRSLVFMALSIFVTGVVLRRRDVT